MLSSSKYFLATSIDQLGRLVYQVQSMRVACPHPKSCSAVPKLIADWSAFSAVLSVDVFVVLVSLLGFVVVLADPSAFHLFSQFVVPSLVSCPSRGAYQISV
jgi:hypothetical protein